MQRREFLSALAASGSAMVSNLPLAEENAPNSAPKSAPINNLQPNAQNSPQITWTIFSRHLQWLTTQDFAHSKPYETGVLIGQKAQEIGFRAVDLTVRQTGFVDPSRADINVNLPQMLKGIRSTGASCEHITTNIELAENSIGTYMGKPIMPEDLLRVAHDNGIRLYRWGGFNYNISDKLFGEALLAQLDAHALKLARLAALNQQYALTAIYHTFSGGNAARSVWDLMRIIEHYRAEQLALNFDIGHMVREGALSAWSSNLRYAMPRINSVGLKDAMLARNPNGTIASSFPQAGTGLVQWVPFFQLLKEGGFHGPAEAQYEYDRVGLKGMAASLNTNFWSDHAQFVSGNLSAALMTEELKKDIAFYKAQALAAGWAADQFV